MTRNEITEQIQQELDNSKNPQFKNCANRLTDLLIQLSDERCKEQREICAHECNVYTNVSFGTSNVIKNAPLPEIK